MELTSLGTKGHVDLQSSLAKLATIWVTMSRSDLRTHLKGNYTKYVFGDWYIEKKRTGFVAFVAHSHYIDY